MLDKYTSKLDDARKKAIERGLAEATGAPSPRAASGATRSAGGFPSAASTAAPSSPARPSSARMSASSLVAQAVKGAARAGPGVGNRQGTSVAAAPKGPKTGAGTSATAQGGKKAAPAGGKGAAGDGTDPSSCTTLAPLRSFSQLTLLGAVLMLTSPDDVSIITTHSPVVRRLLRCRRRIGISLQRHTAVPPDGAVRGGDHQGAVER